MHAAVKDVAFLRLSKWANGRIQFSHLSLKLFNVTRKELVDAL
jgi:hypothetical protein